MKPHRGNLILVFGILSFGVCPFFGIAAWVMGNTDLRAMADGIMDPSGRDLSAIPKLRSVVPECSYRINPRRACRGIQSCQN